MVPNNLRQPGNTIDSIISNVIQVQQAILEEDAYEAVRLQDASQAADDRVEGRNRTLICDLQDALTRLKRNLKYMIRLQSDVEQELNKQLASLMPLDKHLNPDGNMHSSLTNWIEDANKTLLDLISKVPAPTAKHEKEKASASYEDSDGGSNRRRIICLPAIHETEDFKRLAVFRQVRALYKELSPERKICLLSFGVFPENREVKRTMLMYWWIGEGILPEETNPEDRILPEEYKPEEVVKKILTDFVGQNLIEPVKDKRKLEPSSYKMSPFVHSSVVLISTEIGLFDIYHKGKKPTMKNSYFNKVCLVEGSSNQPEAKSRGMDKDHIETVFNVSEIFPEFTYKWFSKKKLLKVLYMGRWEITKREIQIELSRRGMENLSSMRKLRFLSFQGILAIKRLSFSAHTLRELIILDLRGCYNLESLPKKIHKLKKLVYLDLTGCDTLEGIPTGLALLFNLEVLKGFVVSDDRETACDLITLKCLSKLRKLTITIDREGFGLDKLIEAIEAFKALEKLKVRWGNRLSKSIKQQDKKLKNSSNPQVKHRLPRQLRKLDMQRFPHSELPDWLQPHNLKDLEKLYLRSWIHLIGFGAAPGEPTDSCRLKGFDKAGEEPTNCCVKVLRLKYLKNLKVEWGDLTQLYFPKLSFLESVNCPGITLSACDRDGIWRSDEQITRE